MYLSRFGVKNYKCLGDIDIPLTPIHVLIGENDAGKTSLLEAMAAYCATYEKDLAEIFPGAWSDRELVNYASSVAHVYFQAEWTVVQPDEIDAQCSKYRHSFGVDFAAAQDARKCTDLGGWFETDGRRRCPHSLKGPPSVFTDEERQVRDDAYRVIARGRKPAHLYRLDAKVMAVPAGIDPQRRFKLDPDGFGLATLLMDILGYDADLFLHLRREFCRFFPQFKSIRVESASALVRRYVHGDLHSSTKGSGNGVLFETQGGQTIRAQQASDGAILFLGFLALAHLPDPPTLLLVEEPENGIYPKRLEEVINILKELVQRTEGVRFPQIIMTTHSPYVLSFFEPEEVTFLSRPPGNPDGPVRARPLRDAPNIHERLGDQFYLGELWYNLSEEELFGEP